MKNFLFTSVFLFSLTSLANEMPEVNYIMCQNGNIIRTVRIELFDQGCRTVYTKYGKDRVIGSGQFVISCTGFLNNVKKNLEEAGWKCRDISGADITKGTP